MLEKLAKRIRNLSAPNVGGGRPGAAEIQLWMQTKIGQALDVPPESLDPTQPITGYGLDSIAGFTLTSELADWLERELAAELLWEYPTIAELAQHLSEHEPTENE